MKRLMVRLLALSAGVLCCMDGLAAMRSVDEMIDDYLGKKTWSEGRNEIGGKVVFVAKGTGVIQAPKTSANYVDSRVNAYNKAMYEAKKSMVEFLGVEIGSKADLMLESGADLVGPTTGELAAAKAVSQEAYQKLVQSAAAARVMGMQCDCSFESIPEGDEKGEIGVVAVWSPKLNAMAMAMVTGGAVPDGAIKAPIAEQIPSDPAVLMATFGVRQMLDEKGRLVLVSFGQAGGASESKMSLKVAKEKARTNAMAGIREFAGEQVAVATAMANAESATELENAAEIYKDESSSKERIEAAAKSMKFSGISPMKSWQAKHPVSGKTVCGQVCCWSPADSYLAKTMLNQRPQAKRPASQPAAPSAGFVGKGSPADETAVVGDKVPLAVDAGARIYLEASSDDLRDRFTQLFVNDGMVISDTPDGASFKLVLKGKYRLVKNPLDNADGTQLSVNVRLSAIDDSQVYLSYNNDPRKAVAFSGDADRQCEAATLKAYQQMKAGLKKALREAKPRMAE